MFRLNVMSIYSPGKIRALVVTMFICAALALPIIARSAPSQNLADLIVQSDRILMGTVVMVSGGFTEQGVPYTESI